MTMKQEQNNTMETKDKGKEKAKGSFVFYKDWWEALKEFPEVTRLSAIEAIMNYAFEGKEPEDPTMRFATAQIRMFIDRDRERFEKAVQQRKDAIRKRWEKAKQQKEYEAIRANTSEYDRIKPNTSEYNNVNDNVNDNGATVSKDTDSNNNKKRECIEKKDAADAATLNNEDAAHAATLSERKAKFYYECSLFTKKYGAAIVREFFDFWTETNATGTKMKFEMERTWQTGYRIARWAGRKEHFDKQKNKPRKAVIGDIYAHVYKNPE